MANANLKAKIMLRTPEPLQQNFKIPAESGRGRAIPRVLFAYAGEKSSTQLPVPSTQKTEDLVQGTPARRRGKTAFLATAIAMTMRGALPEFGGRRSGMRTVTQDDLAAASGLSRPAFTRRLSAFSNDRGKTMEQTLHRDPRRNILVNRRQRFAQANAYSYALPQGKDARNPDRYIPATLEQVLNDPRLAGRWTAEGLPVDDAGRPKCGGFKDVPEWLWDSRLPLSDTARLVMTYYICCGLLDPRRHDKSLFGIQDAAPVKGVVNPKQSTVAHALGLSIKSVYLANRELEGKGACKWGVREIATGNWAMWTYSQTKAGEVCIRMNTPSNEGAKWEVAQVPPVCLIRVAHDPPTRDAQGGWHRGPAKIVYLPIRQLTLAEAQIERQRFKAEIFKRTGGQEPRGMLAEAVSIHQELLDAWQGREHALRVFWAECQARMVRAGIHRSLISELIPKPPE